MHVQLKKNVLIEMKKFVSIEEYNKLIIDKIFLLYIISLALTI
jgi:hypothetical protein